MRNIVLAFALVALAAVCLQAGDITPNGMSQKDLVQFLTNARNVINNHCESTAAVVANAPSPTYLCASATTVVVDGVFVTTTATNTISFTSGHASLGASKACVFGVCVNAAGTYSTIQGGIVPSTETPSNPAAVSSKALLGTVKVVTNSTGVFVPNTTSLAAASVTVTITQMSHFPVSLTGL